MMSTRARLTVSYAVLLLATMLTFVVALLVGQSKSGTQAAIATNAFRVADIVVQTLQTGQRLHPKLTYIDSTGATGPQTRGTKELGDLLDPLPGYFMVLDPAGKQLYTSTLMRLLSSDDQTQFLRAALRLTDENVAASVSVLGDSLRLLAVARGATAAGPNFSRVIAAMPITGSDVPTQLLVGTMVMLAPIIFLVSMGVAYLVVGRSFKPVDDLINEVEAITDGRSLHRRLPADTSNDELARLSITVNAMLARLETSFGALRRFTADASHELKTPLTVLRADVERSMHPATSRADRMVALEEALQETARMSDLVNSLLTLARADEGRFDIHRTPVEMEPLLREIY
jgi:two-component system, OmpR family, sensor kinase